MFRVRSLQGKGYTAAAVRDIANILRLDQPGGEPARVSGIMRRLS